MNNTVSRVREGFTIIEIMVAVFIIGLVMGVIGVGINTYLKSARNSTAESQLRNIKTAIELYNMTMNEYPKTLEDLIQPPTDERLAQKWIKFLETDRVPKDPWGHEYIYQLTPGSEHEFDLYSEGSDKKQKKSVWAL
jgi:general secretion pathway protein G